METTVPSAKTANSDPSLHVGASQRAEDCFPYGSVFQVGGERKNKQKKNRNKQNWNFQTGARTAASHKDWCGCERNLLLCLQRRSGALFIFMTSATLLGEAHSWQLLRSRRLFSIHYWFSPANSCSPGRLPGCKSRCSDIARNTRNSFSRTTGSHFCVGTLLTSAEFSLTSAYKH